MLLKVKSTEAISDFERAKIKSIFEESNCPNESLKSSFNDYNKIDGNTLYFGQYFYDYECDIEVEPKAVI